MNKEENIILIGMPAAGKSTIGVILAKTLGMGFLDVDLLIQEREDQLLQDLIDEFGMDYFLQKEESALLSVNTAHTVIATGGSAVYSNKGMAHIANQGKIIYLRLPFETIESRLHNINSRGIAMGAGENLRDLYNRRIPLYEQYADITIEAEGLSVEEVVEKVIHMKMT